MKLFFRLGINPSLSLAEIRSYLDFAAVKYTIEAVSMEVAILEIENISHPENLIKELGGTVKIGEVFSEIDRSKVKKEISFVVKAELEKFEGKKFFGFSVVGQQKDFKGVGDLNRFGLEIKNELESSSRLVTSKEIELSSVIVQKEKLLRRGGDFNIIYIGDDIYLGKTLAVQEFEQYGFRDFERPGFDPKSGMLPPKLAKMMVNLAQAKKDATILDPFCGSGTMVVELLLKGYASVIGSDNSPRAIEDSKKNLDWFAEKFHMNVAQVRVFESDARQLPEQIAPGSIGAIVTEPYLGPALRGGETRERIFVIKRELEDLYRSSLAILSQLLAKGAKLVIVVPVFAHQNELIYLDILDDLTKNGLKLETEFENIENEEFRYPLVYRRSGQKLYREILVFTRVDL